MPAQLSRARFIRLTSALGAGLTLGVQLPACGAADAQAFEPNAWVRIDPDGDVTVYLGKSEMGQGIATGLPTILADELDAPFERVRVEFAVADAKYNDPFSRQMSTGGSTSVEHSWMQMRTAGATARAMLVSAAAKRWSVDPGSCTTRAGMVYHASSGRSATYGSLASAAATLPVPANVPLKTPDRFTLIGKQQTRLDLPAKVDGTARFGIDVRLPGMLYAAVARCPVFGGSLKTFDAAKAKAVPGVKDVVRISSGVAVVAGNTWAALSGKDALEITWDEGANAHLDSAGLFAEAERLARGPARVAKRVGDVEHATGTVIEATYRGPFLAHAAMEPMNATADVRGDRCEVWAPTQSQTRAQQAAARVTGLPLERCTLRTTYLGGGFGRRNNVDYVEDAVEISKAMRAPVQVTWSREDDIQHDFYRPMSLNVVRGVLDDRGTLIALSHTVVSASIMRTFIPGGVGDRADPTAVNGAANLLYEIPNFYAGYVEQDHGIPVGFWRAPGANWNTFVTETFIDELAHAARTDPLAFRLAMLGGAPRAAAVLRLAAERAGWGRPAQAGVHRGLALSVWNGSVGALVAEVTMAGSRPKVRRVVMAVDVGIVINPAIVTAQVESAVIYALSAALAEQITLKNGRVSQHNFYDYAVLRMADAPAIEVHIVPSREDPTGIGELGTPPLAPAVANAVFAATGKRVRSLPFEQALA